MSAGRHARHGIGTGAKIALVVVLVLGLTGGGATYAALRYDRENQGRILPGVSIAGVDVSGMTRDQAVAAVTQWARPTLFTPVTISVAGHRFRETPFDLGMRAQVTAVVDRALGVSSELDTAERVWHRLRDEPVGVRLSLRFRPNRSTVESFARDVGDKIAVAPVDAAVTMENGQVVFQHSKSGLALDVKPSTDRILKALRSGSDSVSLPTSPVAPTVSDKTLGATLVVRRDVHKLYLYEGLHLAKTYPVATAMEPYVTPPGKWTIVNKEENPTWINPAPDTWGAGMPSSIPPGPGNPLGTRALYLSAPGIRIHGTYDVDSIGSNASHGCIRMFMSDVQDLYPHVAIGTTVYIV